MSALDWQTLAGAALCRTLADAAFPTQQLPEGMDIKVRWMCK